VSDDPAPSVPLPSVPLPSVPLPSSAPNPSRAVEITVEDPDAGERADVVLGRRVAGLSRRQARALARAGGLRIDDRKRPGSTRVDVGARLRLALDALGDPALEQAQRAQVSTLQLLAETDDFIYVLKPAGVHTVALTPGQPGTLATAVAQRWPECGSASPDPREGGAVHRLDQPTSGVVAFARSQKIWEQARQAFTDERVAKHYLAVCERLDDQGDPSFWPPALPEDGLRGWLEPADQPLEPLELDLGPTESLLELPTLRIRAALGRGPQGPRPSSAVRLDGRRACTRVQPLARHGRRWLLQLLLETGRRHQARVHLAWVHMPIVGDDLYGSEPRSDRSAIATTINATPAIHLHACAIDLSGVFPAELAVRAPLPPGFWPA